MVQLLPIPKDTKELLLGKSQLSSTINKSKRKGRSRKQIRNSAKRGQGKPR